MEYAPTLQQAELFRRVYKECQKRGIKGISKVVPFLDNSCYDFIERYRQQKKEAGKVRVIARHERIGLEAA